MDVGIRELKQKLSEYVERAARGERIRVTHRGEPRAVIGPLPERLRLDQGISEGWVTPPTGRPTGHVRRAQSARRVADVLAEDRDE